MEIRSTKHIILPPPAPPSMCLGSICRGSAARTDRDLRQSCKRLYERHHLGSAGARVVTQAIFKWHQFLRNCSLYLPATWRMQTFPLAKKGKRQTVLADSYSIVLQPLIWISYGHSIRRFSLSSEVTSPRVSSISMEIRGRLRVGLSRCSAKNEGLRRSHPESVHAHLVMLLARRLSRRLVLSRKIASPRESARASPLARSSWHAPLRAHVAGDNSCEASLLSKL